VSKEPSRKLTIRAGNLIRYRVLLFELTQAESIVKLVGDKSRNPDPYVHLGIVTKALGIEPHITYEPHGKIPKSHEALRPMSREEILKRTLVIFSTPESRPPTVTSVENREQMDRVNQWFRKAARRVIHTPRHRRIKVFKEGPPKDFVSKILNSDMSHGIDIDLDEATRIGRTKWDDPDLLHSVFEDEFLPSGLEIGFLERPNRVVFLPPGKPVMELNVRMLMRWIHSLDRMPGVRELLAEAQKRIAQK
jgi:hypothetical protein